MFNMFSECDFTEGQGGWKDWSERKDSGTGQTTYVPSTPFYQDYRLVSHVCIK
jgi:hypothetical protein